MGETEADQVLRRQLEAAEARRRQEWEAAGERARQEEARLALEALKKDRDAVALMQVLLGMLKRLEYAGMEPVEIQHEHQAGVPGKRKIGNLPTVVKAGWRIGEHYETLFLTPEYGDPIHKTDTFPVYQLSDGRVVAAVNYSVLPDGTVAGAQPNAPGIRFLSGVVNFLGTCHWRTAQTHFASRPAAMLKDFVIGTKS